MPVKSEKQRRFMAAVANNKDFANKVGVPTRVGKEFMNMTKKYKAGGKLEMVEKGGKKVPFYAADGKGKMQEGGKVKKDFRDNKARRIFMEAANNYPESKASEKSVQKTKPKRKKLKEMMSGGKVKKGYKSGCQVRGYGMARGGKVCKIVTMKGA